MKLNNKFLFLFIYITFFVFGLLAYSQKSYAWTTVQAYDNNPGTIWGTSIEYRAHWNGSSNADVWGPVVIWSDASTFAFNNPLYNVDRLRDTVKWLTSCVDPVVPVDADSITTFGIQFDDVEVDVTCKTGINNRIYGACDSPNNKGSVGLNELCPASSIICATGGVSNWPDTCRDSCGGTNNCTFTARECYKQGDRNPGCRVANTINNAARCNDPDGGNDGGNRCAPPPPGNRTDSAFCQGTAGTDRAAGVRMNWDAISYAAANNTYDIQLEQTDGGDPHNINDIDPTVYEFPGNACDTGPGGCSLPYNTAYRWRVRGHTSSGHSGPTDWSAWNNITTNDCNGLPDLDVSSFNYPGGNEAGTSNPTVVIRNRLDGYRNVTQNFIVRVCPRNDDNAGCRDHTVTQTLSEGETLDLSQYFTGMPRPQANAAGNPWTAIVRVDPGDANVNEFRENNNTATDNYNTTARISGKIWVDENRDGTIDPGIDTAYHNGLTYWDGQKNIMINGTAYAVNVNDGTYQTGELARDDYDPNLNAANTPQYYDKLIDPPAFNLTTNNNGDNKDFLIRLQTSTIRVNVYEDYNGNAIDGDSGDNPYTGATITLTGNNAGTFRDGGAGDDDGALDGTITIDNVLPGTSSIRLTTPAGYTYVALQPAQPRSVTVPGNRTINFYIQPPAPTCGTVTATPNTRYPGESSTVRVTCQVGGQSGTLNYTWSTTAGTVSPANSNSVASNTQTSTTWTAPATYWNWDDIPVSVTVCQTGSAGQLCTQTGTTIELIPLFSISGSVFVDTNKNGLRDGGESLYTASDIQISLSPNSTATQSNNTPNNTGSYTIGRIVANNTYTVTYVNPPAGFIITYPPTIGGNPRFQNITLGNADTLATGGTTCNDGINGVNLCDANGNIVNLSFGISDSVPWYQSNGSDIWLNSGITNPIPQNATTCTPIASLDSNGTPGVMYSGTGSYSFCAPGFAGTTCQDFASSRRWVVGGSNPENYTPANNIIKTSHSYITSLIAQNNLTSRNIAEVCDDNNNAATGSLANCNLPANLTNGIYRASGALTITDATNSFVNGRDYVIIIDGNLNINSDIITPIGATVLFTAQDDIIVDSNIGTATLNSQTAQLQGWFSADNNFRINGSSGASCPTPDRRLNIEGAVVVNASLQGGSFENNRDLCDINKQCPAFFVKERPDFTLNAPLFLRSTQRIWQEVAP